MVTWYDALIGCVGAERVAELVVSRRNAEWSRERGGREVGAGHYPAMVALHTGLLAGCVVESAAFGRRPVSRIAIPMVVLAAASQGLRWWCIATLGHQWNTRVIVVPGLPRVVTGPYRWMNHPNYVAVVVEGLALPMAGGAWVTAGLFTALNAGLLRVRIRTESAALATALRTAATSPSTDSGG